MKPSKTAFKLYRKPAKKRPAKKRPAKRSDNPVIDKLLKLKYRINDAYHDRDIDTKSDKDFVIGLINNIRNGTNLPVSRIQLEECNKIWKRYA